MYKSRSPGTQPVGSEKTIAQGGQNSQKHATILADQMNRHPPALVRPARDGYPQDRPPQILVQSKNELNSPYSLFSRSIISPQPTSNGSFREGMSLTWSDSFRSTTLSSRCLSIWFMTIRNRPMRGRCAGGAISVSGNECHRCRHCVMR